MSELKRYDVPMQRLLQRATPGKFPDDCWAWTGARVGRGYGQIWFFGRTQLAHRISFLLFRDEIPEGAFVLHSCDNPPCCNPAHLKLGSSLDNNRDMRSKGRAARIVGEKHPRAKLTELRAIEILEGFRLGARQVDLAEEYGVSRHVIYDLVRGRSWPHLTAEEQPDE